MAREEFEIEIDCQGKVTIRTIGIKGARCLDAARAIAPCWVIWDAGRRFVNGPSNCSGRANPLALAHFDGTPRFTG